MTKNKNYKDKIIYGRFNFIFYFFWSTLKLKILFKRPSYVYSYFLYNINYLILKFSRFFSKLPNFKSNKYKLEKINIDDEFIKEVETILNNPVKYELNKEQKKNNRYVYHSNFNFDYFNQVTIQSEKNYPIKV